jgi:hypothetical protein
MNDNNAEPIADARILAAMKAVNPPIERLMADRFALRREVQNLHLVRDVLIPRYIAAAKGVTLVAATIATMAVAAALYTGLLEAKTTGSLFASLLLPLWLVDMAESRFGRWEIQLGAPFGFRFKPRTA